MGSLSPQPNGSMPGPYQDATTVLVAYDELESYRSFLLKQPMLSVLAALVLASVLYFEGNAIHRGYKAPFSGWSTTSLSRWQFAVSAKHVIADGYNNFKNQVFKLSGNDMLIVPAKFARELADAPDTMVDAIKANTDNFQGVYSATAVLNQSSLHNYVIQRRLTPKLSHLVPIVCEELDYAIEQEFPDCEGEWSSQPGFELLIHLISRLASRLFVGPELCRNTEWLDTSRTYTESAFKTIVILRCFPNWMKPVASFFLPWSWKVTLAHNKARKTLVPLIEKRRVEKAAGKSEDGLKFTNLLQLMDDDAVGKDRSPESLTDRTLVLTLASSHTTSMAACQALFELCYRPEYIPILREEIESALKEDGGWHKTTLTKLKKLDSFIKEAQRFHPPSILGMKRNILQPMTLSDGTHLPANSHVLLPIVPHQREDPRIPDTDTFDGLRYWKLRQNPDMANKLQFATADEYTLHFGYGKHACPGRFLASNTVKLVLGRLLLDYDMRFPKGQGRPKDLHAHEYIFPSIFGKVEFKRRSRGET